MTSQRSKETPISDRARKVASSAAALLFILAGTFHLLSPALFAKIVPPYLPQPMLLVYVSGLAELAGGAGLLISRMRRRAAWGLTALLIAVFPANIYLATNSIQVTAKPLPQWILWARLPLQLVLIGWILWCTKRDDE